jgi:hypothetical protein
MGLCHRKNAFATLFMLSILSASLQLGAMRPLGIQWLKQEGLLFHFLPKGPVTPSRPNPCTYIPKRGSGTCKLNGMNIAGSVVARSPPAFSKHTVLDVPVASSSIAENTRDQDRSSWYCFFRSGVLIIGSVLQIYTSWIPKMEMIMRHIQSLQLY